MKALTLHQPWATAVSLGLKSVETRSWRTDYRGPLAIHAGQRRPPQVHIPPTRFSRDRAKWAEVDAHNHSTCFVIDTITDPAFKGPQPQGRRIPKRAQTPTLFLPHATHPWDKEAGTSATEQGTAVYLPLGAIVATCRLVDVVPTSDLTFGTEPGWRADVERTGEDHVESVYVGPDQLPWGDFSPGRWAWLLDDVKPTTERCPECEGGKRVADLRPEARRSFGYPQGWRSCPTCDGEGRCDPVPARGRQGLWEWTP